jgi:3-hydroxymyristoyl/3-hydroxydecanoyl-(acyl carrier protein) dehydratase
MSTDVIYDIEAIKAILPHRPPFLFVDRVVKLLPDVSIVAQRDLNPAEFYFAGHFPGKPVMPGVLLADALAQTSGLLWGLSEKLSREGENRAAEHPGRIFFLAAVDIKFVKPAFPGDTLQLFAEMKMQFGDLLNYAVEASVGRKLIAKGTLTLAQSEQTV